jgi:hypothetical protein
MKQEALQAVCIVLTHFFNIYCGETTQQEIRNEKYLAKTGTILF